jgi:hypothetical protein
MMNTAVKWAAELAHVKEVSLLGAADLSFWKDWLKEEGIFPAESDGQAQLLVVAADSKFMGVRFRELSFSVLVASGQDGAWRDAAYLAGAFNSCRLFAFCERAFFSTPYRHGAVGVFASPPASISLAKSGEVVFRAQMEACASGPGRQPSRSQEEGWEGPVFLPGNRRGRGRQGRLFFARLRGFTQAYPFLPGRDSVTINPLPDNEVLQALVDSHFVAREWAVRTDATHAKSKTYKRASVLPSGGV